MRLLPIGPDHGGNCAAQAQCQSVRRRYRSGDDQYLPLRDLWRHSKRDPQSRGAHGERLNAMELDRREFIVATAVVSGGLGLSLIAPAEAAQTAGFTRVNRMPWLAPAEGGAEVSRWIVIAPDDRVLIRVNQSDLGQGVLTSNPMMICEELGCDWSNVQSVYAERNRHIRDHNLHDHLHTEASSSVRLGRVLYQQAGASARDPLKATPEEA